MTERCRWRSRGGAPGVAQAASWRPSHLLSQEETRRPDLSSPGRAQASSAPAPAAQRPGVAFLPSRPSLGSGWKSVGGDAGGLRARLTCPARSLRFAQVPSTGSAAARLRQTDLLLLWRGQRAHSLWDQTDVGSSPGSTTCSCVILGLLALPELSSHRL